MNKSTYDKEMKNMISFLQNNKEILYHLVVNNKKAISGNFAYKQLEQSIRKLDKQLKDFSRK